MTPLLAVAVLVQVHKGGVTCAAFRPDGQVVATAGWDNTVKVWKLPEGRLLRTHKGHKQHVTGVSYSADGKVLVSSGADGTVRVWSGTSVTAVRTISAGTGYVSDVQISADGKRIFESGYDNRVKCYDTKSGKLVRTYSGLPSDAYCMALSPDGKWVAGGGPESGVAIWPVAGGSPIVLTAVAGDVSGLCFQPSWSRLAVATLNGSVQLFDVESGRLLDGAKGSLGSNSDCEWLDDDRLLVASQDINLDVFTIEDAFALQTSIEADADALQCVAVSKDKKFIVTGGFDESPKIWDTTNWQLVRVLGE